MQRIVCSACPKVGVGIGSHVFAISTKCRFGSHCLVIWNVWTFEVWNYKLFLHLASKIQLCTGLKFCFVANSSVGGFISFKEHISGPIVATVLCITQHTHPARITSEEFCSIILFTWTGRRQKQEKYFFNQPDRFGMPDLPTCTSIRLPSLFWFPASHLSFSQDLREITFYICTFPLVMSSFLL